MKKMLEDALKDFSVEKATKRIQQKNEELRKNSKPLDKLVQTERFIVDSVLSKSYLTRFTPISEFRMGGSSPSYTGGYVIEVKLEVHPADSIIPVRKLNFSGYTAVMAGDSIAAKIPRFEEKTEHQLGALFFDNRDPRYGTNHFYFDRKYCAEESAIEISILDNNNKVLRTERSIEYGNFQKRLVDAQKNKR
jgi:hypothetical protein